MRTIDRFNVPPENNKHNVIPPENYFHITMESLKKSGLFESDINYELHLFDGGSLNLDYLNEYKEWKNVFIHPTDKYITRNENWIRALKYSENVNCNYVIGLEDDLKFCKNWIESIHKFTSENKKLIDNNPMTMFYCPYQEIERKYNNKKLYWLQPYKKFYGTQCIMFTKQRAIHCANHIEHAILNHKDYKFNFRSKISSGMFTQAFDMWLQEWGQSEFPKKYFVASAPSFVQHIGEKGHCKYHTSFFLGEDWSYVKKSNKEFYGEKFQKSQQSKPYVYAKEIIPFLRQHFNINSIIDIGCGRGGFLKAAVEIGIDNVIGVDGNYVKNLIMPKERFIAWNLEEEFKYSRKMDLVVSLEVAEHIGEQYAYTFINTLINLGDLILFSAAQKGQGGINHVNEQPLSYWESKFKKKGFIKHSNIINDFIKDKEHISQWYRKNSILYIKKVKD